MISEIANGKKVVGVKQSRKAVKDGAALKAFIAGDAEERVRAPLVELCISQGVEIEMVSTMSELGGACGISVGAAVAVLIK